MILAVFNFLFNLLTSIAGMYAGQTINLRLHPDSTFTLYNFEPKYQIDGKYTFDKHIIFLEIAQKIKEPPFDNQSKFKLSRTDNVLRNANKGLTLVQVNDPVFGTYADENTVIKLREDSVFEITYFKDNYQSCGAFTFNGREFVLHNIQSKDSFNIKLDCLSTIGYELKGSQNNFNSLFDSMKNIHLRYNQLGVVLVETKMILVPFNHTESD